MSIIQMRPLVKGAWLRGKPLSVRAASMRTMAESDHPIDDGLRTRCFLDAEGREPVDSGHDETARKPMRATKKSCRAK